MAIPINTGLIQQNPNVKRMVADIKSRGLSTTGTMRALTQEEIAEKKPKNEISQSH